MKKNAFYTASTLSFVICFSAIVVQANQYKSPNSITENCVAIEKLASGQYSKKDIEKETELCGYDFYQNNVQMCPKTWSTSPSTLLLELTPQNPFTPSMCESKQMGAYGKLAKFKTSMNEHGTSGTFSQSSILYYHLSRYFNSAIKVPVAVYRSMDKNAHFDLVTSKAKNFENDMVKTAWDFMRQAESINVSAVNPVNELFTTDLKQIYGALIDSVSNQKYGELISGVKQAQWGLPKYLNMAQTPAFKALSLNKSVKDSITEGLNLTAQNFQKDLNKTTPSTAQMIMWMQEMSDMTILDYIMQQQDRPGNIHFQWRVFYMKNNKLNSERIKMMNHGEEVGAEKKYPLYKDKDQVVALATQQFATECASTSCFVMQKSWIEDNDAGGRIYYNKFYRDAKILESVRHINPTTYKQLILLSDAVKSKNTLYLKLKNNFNLDAAQFLQLSKNILDAANILKLNCKSKNLKFDLDFEKYLLTGTVVDEAVTCD